MALPLRVLHITDTDVESARFNGLGVKDAMAARGIETRLASWRHRSPDPAVTPFLPHRFARVLAGWAHRLEERLSLQALLHLQSLLFVLGREFRAADVLHLHLIHNHFFSLLALPLMSRLKPTVWSWHDPWALTGHCVHPMECTRWQTGCGACPDLEAPFAVRADRTGLMFRLKRLAYRASRLDVVCGSTWMLELARRSPLAAGLGLHHIPNGLDLSVFRPRNQAAAQASLGIAPGSRVILLRAMEGPWKGLPQLREALARIRPKARVALLAVQGRGHLTMLEDRYRIHEQGWVDHPGRMAELYAASDFLAMPSRGETFGNMAAEAMACGRPVLCFAGTALPTTAAAPGIGRAVSRDDVAALARALEEWIDDPAETARRGAKALDFARVHYDRERHADALAALYRANHAEFHRRR